MPDVSPLPGLLPSVLGVFASPSHSFSKTPQASLTLLEGLGVRGDAHCGARVQHQFDARRDPSQPNLKQVHLMPAELFDELAGKGYAVGPGALGENIATRGIDLIRLPRGARLHIGDQVVVEITGLRSCCVQLDRFRPGILRELIVKADGRLVRRAGVHAVVVRGGAVKPDDAIRIHLPAGPHEGLEVV